MVFPFLNYTSFIDFYTLSLHDALPISINMVAFAASVYALHRLAVQWFERPEFVLATVLLYAFGFPAWYFNAFLLSGNLGIPDRKSTRLNSSHVEISYAVFCLKKKNNNK